MTDSPLQLHVATGGNDTASGANPRPPAANGNDGPLATLAAAQQAARIARATAPNTPIQILVHAGTYPLAAPLVLTHEDSGTPEAPLTIAPAGDGPVILSAGRPLSGWTVTAEGLWTTRVTGVSPATRTYTQLFVNDARRPRTRLPKTGLLPVDPFNTEDPEADENRTAFRFRNADLRTDWKNPDDIELVVCQFWTDTRTRMAAIDESTGICRIHGSSWRPLNWATGFYLENVPLPLEPGQWYLDRSTGVLTYHPLPGEKPETASAVLAEGIHLLCLQGDPSANKPVEHVHIRGLTFHHADYTLPPQGRSVPQAELDLPAAVYVRGARHCRFDGCTFAHAAAWALELADGCRNNTVTACRFHDLGSGAVRIGTASNPRTDADVTAGNTVSHCDIRDGALLHLGTPAIWIGHSEANIIADNEIQGPFHWAVSVGWSWSYWKYTAARDNLIERNHCHHIGTELCGAHAALYALGIQPGTVFRNNHVHDVHGWAHAPDVASGCGIILDNSCSGIVVENNLVHHCHGGFCANFNVIGNIVQNNIFAFNRAGQLSRYGDPAPRGEWLPNPMVFRYNILCWDEGKLFFDEDWPNFGTFWDFNCYHDARGKFTFMNYTIDQWHEKHMDRHSVVADPLFRNPAEGDFRLDPASPAITVGFKPFKL